MRIDAIVAGGCAATYVATSAWAALGTAFVAPFGTIVCVKDALIAGICLAWMMAERVAGPRRARGIALAAALIILIDAVLALIGGTGPWRADISTTPSQVGGLVVGTALILLGLGLVRFVRRPDGGAA